ncbi:2-amino-4-hydroxy-6-hydroxymethyldihydropteridine diphosphokinase [Chromatiaceae bacterium AAb-1]|nr:2-amino-4-hydroxy-6-hydroxymethyldihydropteridine diphosphokinase [Chromatiaceae bacterium AAb-1]
MTEAVCYIGLGANLHQPVAQLQAALSHLQQLPHSKLTAVSSFYSSRPMGPQDQPDYVNAVAQISTALSPEALLDQLQRIELEQGRQRKDERWGPRTLDLDILLFGDRQINTARLTIPHYGMKQREFVLYPLAEIAPQLVLPCGTVLTALLQQTPLNGLHKLPALAAADTLCHLAQPD